MNRFRNSLIALTGAIGIALSVTTSWAGEGHDHDEAPVAAGGPALPRFTAESELFELVGEVPDPAARYLKRVYVAQVEALATLQRPDGMWTTLLVDQASPIETSATAGFAYGILKAVRKRYVGQHYAGVAEKAIRGIVQNISPQGELLQTSFGTGMGSDLDFYRQTPLTSMPYGQAMAILCLTEYLRKYF